MGGRGDYHHHHALATRVDSVFRNVNIPLQASEALMWRRVQLQLRALIKRLHSRADTAVRGVQLAACFDIFISSSRGSQVFQAGLPAIGATWTL